MHSWVITATPGIPGGLSKDKVDLWSDPAWLIPYQYLDETSVIVIPPEQLDSWQHWASHIAWADLPV